MGPPIKIVLLQKKREFLNTFLKIQKFIVFKSHSIDKAKASIQENKNLKRKEYICNEFYWR